MELITLICPNSSSVWQGNGFSECFSYNFWFRGEFRDLGPGCCTWGYHKKCQRKWEGGYFLIH
ncbi:unnamed protein product, partial [Vitis vinifera]